MEKYQGCHPKIGVKARLPSQEQGGTGSLGDESVLLNRVQARDKVRPVTGPTQKEEMPTWGLYEG